MNKLWNQAMEKLKVDKSHFTGEDVGIIIGFIDIYEKEIPIGISDQILRDVSMYKKFDAIAMWIGDGGLIESEPEFIKELVEMFGIGV